MRADSVRERIALRATEDPRLIKEITMANRNDTTMAFKGIGKLGDTYGIV